MNPAKIQPVPQPWSRSHTGHGQGRSYSPKRVLVGVALLLALVAASCGGSDTGSSSFDEDSGMAAQVASFDLVVGQPSRLLVGLFAEDQAQVLAYGGVTFQFIAPATEPTTVHSSAAASFLPIPGQDGDPDEAAPRFVGASIALGVYGTSTLTFDQPGFWQVHVVADTDEGQLSANAAFEVLESSTVPAVGDAAPRTIQPLAGDPDVDPSAIDSRAHSEAPVPDLNLHRTTIADALDERRSMMVVISTPTFCQSRFCGPIVDSIAALANVYGDDMEFVHLEIWEDFNNDEINDYILPWIAPTPEIAAREPWVFVINDEGVIVERFDNVATDAELEDAVVDLVG